MIVSVYSMCSGLKKYELFVLIRKFTCDLCSLCTESNKKNFDIVKVTWFRVQQSGGDKKNSDLRWILRTDASALIQAFFNEYYGGNIFSKFTKLFLYL